MRLRQKRFLWGLVVLLGIAGVGFFTLAAPLVDQKMNAVRGKTRPVSAEASALHAQMFIADLHADSLLWGRDLVQRGPRGHLDLPRLTDGNVALQVFDVVTQTPRGLNIDRNDDSTDNILLLALAQRWPRATWSSLLARALYQAERLRETAARSKGRLWLVKSRVELGEFRDVRRNDPGLVAAVLGLEGAQALQGEVANLDALYDAGFRIVSPSHFFDTEIGGSSAGVNKGGLTAAGRRFVQRMEEKRMVIDLAHASAQTLDDVLAMAHRPVIVSHTGVRGTCDNNRNLSDAQLDKVAAGGGLVGIGYWPVAVCGDDAAAIARAIVYAGKRIGFDHVALGSDYDGAIAAPFDVTGIAQITDALFEQKLDEGQIRRVMGLNVARFLGEQLP